MEQICAKTLNKWKFIKFSGGIKSTFLDYDQTIKKKELSFSKRRPFSTLDKFAAQNRQLKTIQFWKSTCSRLSIPIQKIALKITKFRWSRLLKSYKNAKREIIDLDSFFTGTSLASIICLEVWRLLLGFGPHSH